MRIYLGSPSVWRVSAIFFVLIALVFSQAPVSSDECVQAGDSSSCEVKKEKKKIFHSVTNWMDDRKKDLKRIISKNQHGDTAFDNWSMFSSEEAVKETDRSDDAKQAEENHNKLWDSVGTIAKAFVMGNDNDRSKEDAAAVEDLLFQQARNIASSSQSVQESRSFTDMWNLFTDSMAIAKDQIAEAFGTLNLDNLKAPALYYFVEFQDAVKHPSWKRRQHRFHKAINSDELYEWHNALYLCELSYTDTEEQIEAGLRSTKEQWKMIYTQMASAPNEPAHFLAIPNPKNKKKKSFFEKDYLDVLITVRGTKQLGDIVSDIMLKDIDFFFGQNGKAHAGILKSGMFLVEKHIPLLKELLKKSKKDKIRLKMVGHSLGAGAASIAAIILNRDYSDIIEASVIGFGCPAILSHELSQKTKSFITTIVADADLVPRLGAASIINTFMDIMSYDWTPIAVSDLQEFLKAVQKDIPFLSDGITENIVNFANQTLDTTVRPFLNTNTNRLTPALIPPGECIHLFRDGSGVSGTHTPCSFFTSIDVSRTMIDDHLVPPGYHRLFLEFIRDHQGDLQYNFEHSIKA